MDVGIGAYGSMIEVREDKEEVVVTDCMRFAGINPGGKTTNKPGYKPIPILGPKIISVNNRK